MMTNRSSSLTLQTGTGNPGSGDRTQILWRALQRHRWMVLGIVVSVVALTGLFTWLQRPVYQSAATMRIDDDSPQSFLSQSSSSLMPTGGGSKLETEMLVLQSRHIAEAVVDSLNLRLQLLEPNRPRPEVIRPLAMVRDTVGGPFELRWEGADSYSVSVEQGSLRAQDPRRVKIGTPFTLGGMTLALAPSLRSAPPKRIRFALLPLRDAVAQMQTATEVARLDPKAQIIAIRYTGTDPWLTAAVPNAVTHAFIQYKALGSRSESHTAVGFLRQQVSQYEQELSRAEERLRAFRENQQVVSLTDEASEQVKRLAEMQARKDALRSEREALAELLDRINKGKGARGETATYRQLASFPVFLSNKAVQDILQSLTDLENQRAQLLVRRTTENVDVQGFTERIQELELQLFQIGQNYLRSLDSELASSENTLSRFGTQLAAIPAREVQFARLSREQSLLADIYTMLQTRLKEAELKEAVEPENARVIDEAIVPVRPISPRPTRNLVFGLFLGLMLGVGAALGRESLDTRIRSMDDVRTATGGVPVLGTIPRLQGFTASGENGHRRSRIVPVAPETLVQNHLVTRMDPKSPASEAYRTLRTNLTFANLERRTQTLVVTSAAPGDGKSTSASNLAITLAQQGVRTLLVDADLRKGILHELFDISQDPGLTHVLLGTVSRGEAIRRIELEGGTGVLHFLSSGVFPPNPSELLGSERMRQLIGEMRDEYDMIIFDAPPLNIVTDAAVLGTMSDATLLVARAGNTDRRALGQAAAQLQHVRAAVTGVVLNDFEADGSRYTYSYAYGGNGNGNGTS